MEDKEKEEALTLALKSADQLLGMFEASLKKEPFRGVADADYSKAVKRMMSSGEKEKSEVPEPYVPADVRYEMTLDKLKAEALCCTRCKLCSKRTNVVFGEGCTDHPDVMVIGEGPGEKEDIQGRPFVGDSGNYLDKWLASISLSRDRNCYIANVVKCRPPMNRDPQDDEKEACKAFLEQQIALIKPRAILCLGKQASAEITGMKNASMGSMRGRFYFYDKTIPVLCTYHPSAVLRELSLKVAVWEDLKKLAGFLNLEVNGVRR